MVAGCLWTIETQQLQDQRSQHLYLDCTHEYVWYNANNINFYLNVAYIEKINIETGSEIELKLWEREYQYPPFTK